MNHYAADTSLQLDKSVNQALEQILASVPILSCTETVDLKQAYLRVLSQDIISPINVPAHDNSAMDGFAFNGESLSQPHLHTAEGVVLQVIGETFAGHPLPSSVIASKTIGVAVKITTGAVMPDGFDTVVPKENCIFDEKNQCIIVTDAQLKPGDNRRLCGEDLPKGQAALLKGQTIHAAAMGLIASLGIAKVQVMRPLKVAYFSTGDEILSLGDAPQHGAVYDSNRYTVMGMLKKLNCEMIDLGCIPDQPEKLKAAYLQALRQADCIITSGGVSVGEADFTKSMMAELAYSEANKAALGGVEFWRIAMRPGRPMAFGLLPQQHLPSHHQTNATTTAKPALLPVFGLPGNPVAVMITFMIFVKPAIEKMQGQQKRPPLLIKAISEDFIRKKTGRTEYQRAIVNTEANRNKVKLIGNQGSGVLSSMTAANCLVVLGPEQGHIAQGDWVDVMLLE